MSGKGDNPRPLSVTPEQFAARFDAIDWNAREAAELKALVDAGMADLGFAGEATVTRGADGSYEIVFDRGSDRCGVSFGGFISERRNIYHLAKMGVERMAEIYAEHAP